MRLIDADKVKIESRKHCIDCKINGTKHCKTCVVNLICDRLDLQPTVTNPKYKWFDCIENTLLKARHGDYVLYKVDFLLDNLTREVSIMEAVRHTRSNNNGKK